MALGLTLGAFATAAAEPAWPRLANMYTHGSVDPAAFDDLSRWDLLILNSVWTEADLQALRSRNPDIKLFMYVCPYCIESPPNAADAWKQETHAYAEANDLWWYDRRARVASDWPGSRMVNITAQGASGPQGPWRAYIAQRIEDLVRQRPALDGVFLDNYWKSISWNQALLQLDCDCNPTWNPAGCDSTPTPDAELDSLWNQALRSLAQDIRARFDGVENGRSRPLAILSNRASDYFAYLNGTFYEFFPSGWNDVDPGNPFGYNWNAEMFRSPEGYLVAPFATVPAFVSVLNADWTGTPSTPDRSDAFERHKRFTLVSTLLGDGYYSLDAGDDDGHGALWWEPEYDHAGRGKGYLGSPRGAMRRVVLPTGPEMLQDGGFDTGIPPWVMQEFMARGGAQWVTDTAASPPASVRLFLDHEFDPSGSVKLYQWPLDVVQGTAYTLQFAARSLAPTEVLVHLYSESCPGNRCFDDRRIAVDGDWQTYTVSFTATGNANDAGLNFFLLEPGQVWLDDISLREGDSSVYRRDFDNGVVLLNYTAVAQTVPLGADATRLDIPGSPVFDGARVQEEIVPPWDARILLWTRAGGGPPGGEPPTPPGRLSQNVPNPFNPATTIRFEVARTQHVSLGVYDVSGRLVRRLVDRPMAGGTEHVVVWDGRDRFGRPMRSGIYLYRIETAGWERFRKMTLVR